jgi:hypothetical protein
MQEFTLAHPWLTTWICLAAVANIGYLARAIFVSKNRR